jgi:hypothetical protein
MRKNYNDPENWLSWLKACAKDEHSPIRLPEPAGPSTRPLAVFGMLTGQDRRALHAVAACWQLYAGSDDDGREAALTAVCLLLRGLQLQCWPFARELIAQSMDWNDRDRLWSKVVGAAEKRGYGETLLALHDALAALPVSGVSVYSLERPAQKLIPSRCSDREHIDSIDKPGFCVWCDAPLRCPECGISKGHVRTCSKAAVPMIAGATLVRREGL